MRKLFFALIITLTTNFTFAQSSSEAPNQNISTDSNVDYRLFATRNMYTFIKLTRWVKLNDLNFDIINWSVKDKFIDILH